MSKGQHTAPMSLRRRVSLLVAGAAAVSATVAGVVTALPASAATPPLVAGNITMLPTMPRVFGASNPLTLATGQQVTTDIGGETFSGVTVPANATGVTLSVSTVSSGANATGSGQVRVWTGGEGEPGSPTVTFKANEGTSNLGFVALDSAGKINIKAVNIGTKLIIGIVNYVTPVPAPAAPVVKSIAGTARGAINVGGSIRTRGTEVGSVTLTEGTWDARAVASFQGLNSTNNTVPAGVNLSGTFVLVKGDGTPGDDTTIIASDFSNDITSAVPSIPRVSSATLTVDPTALISSFIVVPAGETLKVTAVVFAAASDSSQSGSGELKAGLDSAQFVKVG